MLKMLKLILRFKLSENDYLTVNAENSFLLATTYELRKT